MTVLFVRLCGKLLLRSVQRDTHQKTLLTIVFRRSLLAVSIIPKFQQSRFPGRQINKQSAFDTGVLSASFGTQWLLTALKWLLLILKKNYCRLVRMKNIWTSRSCQPALAHQVLTLDTLRFLGNRVEKNSVTTHSSTHTPTYLIWYPQNLSGMWGKLAIFFL